MARYIDHHVVEGDPNSEALRIYALDEPGAGGANHHYVVTFGSQTLCEVKFQNGPIGENGINGITQEVLLAIVLDRLNSFQNGPFSCIENAIAKQHTEDAIKALKQRTVDRIARNVEGKNEKQYSFFSTLS